ncbi:MAG: GntR family transcriptional regulator [Clostridia bacterium]|nr:GntR family transcriptional regulator [Clostridia bacterium]
MDIKFLIDVNAGRAAYRQIISGITSMVADGDLKPGDRLPSERELAAKLGVSRGTVKKAYDKLCTNGVTQSLEGSGTFISMGQNVISPARKTAAVQEIESLVNRLAELGFSTTEIDTQFRLVMNKFTNSPEVVRIAAIDCSPEALFTFDQQLSYISQVKVDRFLLTDLESGKIRPEQLEEYDIILTTSTHNAEISVMLARLTDRIMQTVVSPDRQTVIELAGIPKDKTAGVLCRSRRYLAVIMQFMTRDINPANIRVLESDPLPEGRFFAKLDYLILPPEDVIAGGDVPAMADFLEKGGRIIYFNYQIERGSLLHIEERISSVLQRKLGGPNG